MVSSNSDALSTLDRAPKGQPSSAAARALAEAEERRAASQTIAAPPQETGGRGGLEPVRFGDWEVKGLASDF